MNKNTKILVEAGANTDYIGIDEYDGSSFYTPNYRTDVQVKYNKYLNEEGFVVTIIKERDFDKHEFNSMSFGPLTEEEAIELVRLTVNQKVI